MIKKRNWVEWLTVALLLLGLARGAALWLHDPMIGLANNYDMIRVQGCIDAYPIRSADIPQWANSWEGPIERYAFRDDVDPGCFLSSETLFAGAALPLAKLQAASSADGGFSLRVIGGVKLAALVLVVLAVTSGLRRAGARLGGLANAALFAVVLTDPGVSIYLNTMYAEFSAVLFSYTAIGLIALAVVSNRPRPGLWALCALALILACLSKVQHLAIGVVVATALLVIQGRTRGVPRGLCWVVCAAALVGLGIQIAHLKSSRLESMRQANLTNTVLQAVLGSSPDAGETAAKLGLPPHCAEHAGKTWFSEGVQENHPCPELFELSRLTIVGTLLRSPTTLINWAHSGFAKARPWIHPLLGKVEGGVSEPVPAYFPSLSAAIDQPGLASFTVLIFAPLLFMAVLLWRSGRGAPSDHATRFVLLCCAVYPVFSLFTIMLGDGFADVAKQFHLGMTLLFAFYLIAILTTTPRTSPPASTPRPLPPR